MRASASTPCKAIPIRVRSTFRGWFWIRRSRQNNGTGSRIFPWKKFWTKSRGMRNKIPTGWRFPNPDAITCAQSNRAAAKIILRDHSGARRGGIVAGDAGTPASGIQLEPGAARNRGGGRRQQGQDVGRGAAVANKNSRVAPGAKHRRTWLWSCHHVRSAPLHGRRGGDHDGRRIRRRARRGALLEIAERRLGLRIRQPVRQGRRRD